MPNGAGSINLGSMVPILIIAFTYGPEIGMFVRFIFHFISGVLFFGEFAPEGWSPMIYSLVVNGSVVGGNLIIILVIIALLPINKIIERSNNFSQ